MQSEEDDDMARRRQDISSFAAMAASGGGSFIAGSSDDSPSTTAVVQPDSSAVIFSEAASAVVDTGTFTMSSSPHAHSAAASSNMEAAAAALSGIENSAKQNNPPPSPGRAYHSGTARPKTKQTPMYAERILMPRHLFFGPILPPRVLKEARSTVANALEKVNGDSNALSKTTRLSSLPAQVRNLVSTIDAFGFGLSVFPSGKVAEIEENDPAFWKGDPYVSTYQPVWGDVARAEREERRRAGRIERAKRTCAKQGMRIKIPSELPTPIKAAAGEVSAENVVPALVTPAGESTTDEISKPLTITEAPTPALFCQWAQGGDSDDANVGAGSIGSTRSAGGESVEVTESPEASDNDSVTRGEKPTSNEISERNLFSQWARGENVASNSSDSGVMKGSFIAAPSTAAPTAGSSVVLSAARTVLTDSDDDSVVGSEMKKKVGANEHLNAALASLFDENSKTAARSSESITAAESHALLSQLCPTTPGGRPLSNLEVTDGCVPLYGGDDTPLPIEADLGIFETKEDQLQNAKRTRAQEIINEHAAPNIFGSIACPNPALGPDDSHSWNSRTTLAQRVANNPSRFTAEMPDSPMGSIASKQGPRSPSTVGSMSATGGHSGRHPPPPINTTHGTIVPPPLTHRIAGPKEKVSSPGTVASATPSTKSQNNISARFGPAGANTRFGWWLVEDDAVTASAIAQENATSPTTFIAPQKTSPTLTHSPLQLQSPPLGHASGSLHVSTRLTPSPEKLRNENLPLSHLHAASSTAEALPYLSDRSPSSRYLQIDTQAVGFPPLGGEVEPLFCSLAIYHVETMSVGSSTSKTAPVPNLQRCGRITEALNFDVVSDVDVEANCTAALFPYASKGESNDKDAGKNGQTQGTRCGVFPLPSNLDVANLYAVLIVHKVLADEADFDAYIKKTETSPGTEQDNSNLGQGDTEIRKLRNNAETASNRYGQFVKPFAFGVAPLLQVIGTENPIVPSSRAVQIPLFRLIAGQGERPIIDHIMVMLYPRADHGNASVGVVTNGGTAVLIMRNYGYLGLHSVIHSKSSLARDRLVDFTGELQVRRRRDSDEIKDLSIELEAKDDFSTYVVPQWRSQFVAEPTTNGGRNMSVKREADKSLSNSNAKEGVHGEQTFTSQLYAQELSSVPLLLTPSTQPRVGVEGNTSSTIQSVDLEPSFHTSFCNELLCHPRLLHNCKEKNIAIKVELREIKWSEDRNAFLAFLPKTGPSIHNPRRGPFLVQEAFTSCVHQTTIAHFMDEFKVKLPLILPQHSIGGGIVAGGLSLLFSAYSITMQGTNKGTERTEKKRAKGRLSMKRGFRGNTESCTSQGLGEDTVDMLACGFLPVTTDAGAICMIENGLHDVQLIYSASKVSSSPFSTSELPPETLIITAPNDVGDAAMNRQLGDMDEVLAQSPHSLDEPLPSDANQFFLQVRVVVHSSVHPQNAALSNFLNASPDQPHTLTNEILQIPDSPWHLQREDLIKRFHSTSQLRKNIGGDEKEKKLLEAAVGVSRASRCPVSHSSLHAVRSLSHLWRLAVAGTGKPSLEWVNPASMIPLRVHSFASLLQMLNSSTHYLNKNGFTQLDGRGKCNMTVMARLVAMLFDEQELFAQSDDVFVEEVCDVNELYVTGKPSERSVDRSIVKMPSDVFEGHTQASSSKKTKETRRKHTRSSNDFSWLSNEGQIPKGSSALDNPAISAQSSLFTESKEQNCVAGRNLSYRSATLPHLSTSKRSASQSAADNKTKKYSSDGGVDSDAPPGYDESNELNSTDDFMIALRTTSKTSLDDSSLVTETTGNRKALDMINAFGSMGNTNRRRFMTAPSSTLSTIREDLDSSDSAKFRKFGTDGNSPPRPQKGAEDALDTEMILRSGPKSVVKQFRVPRFKKSASDDVSKEPLPPPNADSITNLPPQHSLPTSEEDIETAGTAFLDVIGKHLGSSYEKNMKGGEDQRVGYAHHHKTRSRCSIDWTLPDTDTLTENRQQREHIQRRSDGSIDTLSFASSKPKTSAPNTLSDSSTPSNSSLDTIKATGFSSKRTRNATNNTIMSSLNEEDKNTIKLPNFIDRTIALGKANGKGRWFPYVYEVVIFQWVTLLIEQQKTGGKTSQTSSQNDSIGNVSASESTTSQTGRDHGVAQSLANAATRARGATISCAPVLFEVIKKSLGWRVDGITRGSGKAKEKMAGYCAPLVTLDDTLMSTLEQLISMLTDACIDSRNFDSWEFRQTSIDVNDSIIRFLRDMFAFLDTKSAHRLMMIYFSRYVVKNGKHWQDRDSSIGLRCSWEMAKLRMNAVTMFIRFPEFTRVCSPQMNCWESWALTHSSGATRNFFSSALGHFESLNLSTFAAFEGSAQKTTVDIPAMQPHWLAELVADICLSGTEHVEQSIQQRAASLLHELFWSHSQEGRANGSSSAIASMYVPFLLKLLGHINYLSSFPPKSQLRKDIFPCAVFIMQSAPVGLLRALWRKLCARAVGAGLDEKYGGIGEANMPAMADDVSVPDPSPKVFESFKDGHESDIFGVFSLLNLALTTFEYEGCDEHVEPEDDIEGIDQIAVWQKEVLLAAHDDGYDSLASSCPRTARDFTNKEQKPQFFSTSSSRKWQGNDGPIVIINTSRQIVREMLIMMRPSAEDTKALNFSKHLFDSHTKSGACSDKSDDTASSETQDVNLSFGDTVVFVRAATSLYLHALALNQSDVTIVKTLSASVEVVKIFGIKIFVAAVGETLQHWMRAVTMHCGGRRAEVRVQALEFLALILRLTWDTYGSFTRIRLPLLAVQTEVMERIVATATARNYREQRRHGTRMQGLTNDSAEASLTPLWRTLDRLHHSSASQNIAFRSALIRLADKMKKLFRAYIAAHALAILNRARSPLSPSNIALDDGSTFPSEASILLQKSLVIVHRVINASAGFSKQFLGKEGGEPVAHNEAVEDAFLAAADVFSPTELPSHRVAWLRKLAEFHASRSKFAEEATCRFHIQFTFRQAARLRTCLWSSTPFLPWTNDTTEGVHLGGEGPAGDPGEYFDADYEMEDLTVDDYGLLEIESGKQIEKKNSFRRIFYRVANSVRMRTGDWEIGGNKNLFYGVAFAFEYRTVTPWISLKVMEEEMVEEAEIAGDLYLKAGIVESSRYLWNLATQYYAGTFNYERLAHVYKRLATVVASQVPVIDTGNPTSNPVELSSSLGRFYRVWFHGGAPDELIGAELVYRAAGSVKLEQFGLELRDALKSVLPDKNQRIDLVLDDGRPEETSQRRQNQRRPLGVAPIEPVKIKVTPLRPLLKSASRIRGTPEWFNRYTDLIFSGSAPPVSTAHVSDKATNISGNEIARSSYESSGSISRRHTRSFSASVLAASSLSIGGRSSLSHPSKMQNSKSMLPANTTGGGELMDVDMFSFMQPMDKNRYRATRDWLKAASGDLREKCLRVTQLQVEQSFPSCVSRHGVVHRKVFTQSPLEAGVDAVCSWCAVLFRTAVATNGLAVLGTQSDPGIGTAAAKVVADCIHSSRVKEMGQILLKNTALVTGDTDRRDGTLTMIYSMLTDEQFIKLQTQLARAIVVFMELLHLLIARNRDLLLEVVEHRKRRDDVSTAMGMDVSSTVRTHQSHFPNRNGSPDSNARRHARAMSTKSGATSSIADRSHEIGGSRQSIGTRKYHEEARSVASSAFGNDKTDSAIAVQSELQRAFVAMSKTLHPVISGIIENDTPRWFKMCCQDNYFSSYIYRQTRLSIGEELFFSGRGMPSQSDTTGKSGSEEVPFPYDHSSVSPFDHGVAAQIKSSPNGSFCGSSTGRSPARSSLR